MHSRICALARNMCIHTGYLCVPLSPPWTYSSHLRDCGCGWDGGGPWDSAVLSPPVELSPVAVREIESPCLTLN